MKVEDKIILEIIQQHQISEQAELVEVLQQRGIYITQASLSRRLKKLSINKNNGLYSSAYENFGSKIAFAGSIKQVIKSPPNLLVIHTTPGHASSIAYYIDKNSATIASPLHRSNIAGTIAGDDTILIILTDANKLDYIADELANL